MITFQSGLILVCTALFVACAGSGSPERTSMDSSAVITLPAWAAVYDHNVQRDLARVRAATAAFRDIEAAHKVGYPTATPGCLEHPTDGGMGLHYSKEALLDDALDVEQPEILVYAPTAQDKPRLVGVEYVIPIPNWTREEAPTIFGQKLKRAPRLNIWYLHVWSWEQNEQGLFADWNPSVKCGSTHSESTNPGGD